MTLPDICTHVLYCVGRASRQCMFYIQFLYGDRHMHGNICDCTRTHPSLHEALAAVHASAPHPRILRFTACDLRALYLWANRPKLTALEKAHRCTLQVHRNVTHIAQALRAAQSPSTRKTLIVSTVHCCTWPPTLKMVMLWKQNLNIYIRWL